VLQHKEGPTSEHDPNFQTHSKGKRGKDSENKGEQVETMRLAMKIHCH
jgi:hypothetical protein